MIWIILLSQWLYAADKPYADDPQVLSVIVDAIRDCQPQALQSLSDQYHLTVEHYWAIENARKVIETLCVFS